MSILLCFRVNHSSVVLEWESIATLLEDRCILGSNTVSDRTMNSHVLRNPKKPKVKAA